MKSNTRLLTAFLIALFLGACASFKPQAYNREANSEIKRIQVLPMQQANVRLFVFNATGNNFGLIGALITEADRNSKETWLQEQAKAAQFNQFEVYKTMLDEAMSKRGYTLVWSDPLTQLKGIKRDEFGLHKNYQPVAGVQAQLDVGVNFVGFAAAGSGKSQPYRPTVLLAVRLMDASGKKVLFKEQFLHHNVMNNQTAVVIEPNPKYSYPNFGSMKKNSEDVLPALKEAVEKAANALAEQL